MKIRFPVIVPTPLATVVPQASDEGVNIMKDMLQWEPRKRPTATQVHKYMYMYHIHVLYTCITHYTCICIYVYHVLCM